MNVQDAAANPPAGDLPAQPAHAGSPFVGLSGVLIAAGCLLAYHDVTALDFLVLGDVPAIVERDAVRIGLNRETLSAALLQPAAGGWQPLTTLSHALVVTLFSLTPLPHHIVNLVLHMITMILLFRLLARVSGAPLVSLGMALLFALHPIQVENVAWVSGRAAIFAQFFAVLIIDRLTRPEIRTRWMRSGIAVFALGMTFNPWLGLLAPVLPAQMGSRRIYGVAIAIPFLVIAAIVTGAFTYYSGISVASYPFSWLTCVLWPSTVPVSPVTGGAWASPLGGAFAAIILVGVVRIIPSTTTLPYAVYAAFCLSVLVLAAAFGWKSASQVQYWRTDIGLFNHIVEANGGSAEAYAGLGRAYDYFGMNAEATDAYRAALAEDPDDPVLWRSLGASYSRMGAGYPARDAYERALELDPTDPRTQGLLEQLNEGIETVETTTRQLEASLQDESGEWAPIVELGRMYAFMGRADDALTLYEDNLPNPEGSRVLMVVYAEAYSRADMPEQAADHYRKAADLDPEPAAFRYELARQYYRAGNEPAARESLGELLAANPDHELGLRMQRALGW